MSKKSLAVSIATSIALFPVATYANEMNASSPVTAHKASNNCCHTSKTKQKNIKPTTPSVDAQPKQNQNNSQQ